MLGTSKGYLRRFSSNQSTIMDVGSSSIRVEKLNEHNFHAWKQKIQLLLAFKELDELIEDDPPRDTTSAEHAAWRRRDKKAQACIGFTLTDSFLENVREATAAKQMWKAITDVFEKHALLNKLAARRRFYTATVSEREKSCSSPTASGSWRARSSPCLCLLMIRTWRWPS